MKMNINPITLIIAFAIAALAGYCLYAANGAETDIPLANALGGGIALFVTLAGAVSVRTESQGGTMNIRMASGIFFAAMLIEQIVFCIVSFHLTPYIIVTGVLTLVYVLAVYGIGKALDNG